MVLTELLKQNRYLTHRKAERYWNLALVQAGSSFLKTRLVRLYLPVN